MTEVLLLGLVCWIVTTILVESELTRGVRSYTCRRARCAKRSAFFWHEARYFIGCHLCTGVWVGLVLSALFGSPWPGFVGWAAGGLLYKAIGHLVLELRPQAWVK